MRAEPTEMTEHVRVRTTRFLKSIREDREPPVVQCARWQMTLVVGGLSKVDNGAVVPGQPSWSKRVLMKKMAEDVPNQVALSGLLCWSCIATRPPTVTSLPDVNENTLCLLHQGIIIREYAVCRPSGIQFSQSV
jgi:hypothetical protein